MNSLIADTVALNFISTVDELMFQSYFSNATKVRLSKYKFEHRWGLDDGSTTLKDVSALTRRVVTLHRSLPLAWGVFAIIITGLGQAAGYAVGDPQCDLFWTPETV